MTPAVPDPTVEALAEVLSEHVPREFRYEDRHSWGFCTCGWEASGLFPAAHRAHQARILAEHTERAVREALEAAAVRVGDLVVPDDLDAGMSPRLAWCLGALDARNIVREGGRP